MNERKNINILLVLLMSVSLIASAVTAVTLAWVYQNTQFETLGNICQEIVKNKPQAEKAVAAALKESKNKPSEEDNILYKLGYRPADFVIPALGQIILSAGTGFLLGGILLAAALRRKHRKETLRIRELTEYLEQVNTGKAGLTLTSGEDDFSKLQDEIYKTVTMLYQLRDGALKAKDNFADNLSNIAHQIKTPITAISLSTQMIEENPGKRYAMQIQRQLLRLTYLQEALLVLSRIDAGTLNLEKKPVDIFTALTLASDNLQELFMQSGVKLDVQENGEMEIVADMDWTMEAFMNLIKNCMEHTPPGMAVRCSYDKNPLYIEIRIWDEGPGFEKEDIPHLFERFYRGKNAKEGGIGIGLPLAKEIIERQNGTIRAGNLSAGGACFEIRFYSH